MAVTSVHHFLLECPRLERYRDRNIIGSIGGTGDRVDRVGSLLFNKANIEKIKKMLGTLWKERDIILMRYNRESHQQGGKGKVTRGNKLPG